MSLSLGRTFVAEARVFLLAAGGSAYATRRRWVVSSATLRRGIVGAFLPRPVIAMRIVVVVTGSHIARCLAMLVNVPSIMVIATVAPGDRYGCHHH